MAEKITCPSLVYIKKSQTAQIFKTNILQKISNIVKTTFMKKNFTEFLRQRQKLNQFFSTQKQKPCLFTKRLSTN